MADGSLLFTTDDDLYFSDGVIPDTGDLTVEVWYKDLANGDHVSKTSAEGGLGNGWYLGKPSGTISFVSDDVAYLGVGAAMATATWTYAAFVHADAANTVQGYYAESGASGLTTGTLHTSIASPTTNNGRLRLGNVATGSIAFVRVWNRALSSSDLGAVWNKHISGTGASNGLSNLKFNWDEALDTNAGVTAADFLDQEAAAANAVAGTLVRQSDSPTLTLYAAAGGTRTSRIVRQAVKRAAYY